MKNRWMILALALAVVAIVGYLASRQQDTTGGSPYYIANDWTKAHVSYHFQAGVTVPVEFPNYQLQYIAFDRAVLDPVVTQLNPDLLNTVEQTGDTLTYLSADQSLNIQQQENGSVNFEYHLFQTPDGAAYATQNVNQLSQAEQVAVVDTWLAKYPSLLLGYTYAIEGGVHGASVETIYLSVDNEAFSFEAANFVFYNGQLQAIYGSAVTAVTQSDAITYGTNAEIEAQINSNPPFPLTNNLFPDGVNVVYQFTDYQPTDQGLALSYVMQNSEATLQELAVDIDQFSDGAEIVTGTLVIEHRY